MSIKTVYGGGHWTCSTCGKTIYGSSIHHNCIPYIIEEKPKKKHMETFNYNYHPDMERYIARLVKEWREHKKIILCVDFDDTLSPWHFNDFDYTQVFALVKEAQALGAYIVIFSACKPDRYDYIRDYCRETGGFEIDGINENVIELPYGNHKKIYYNHFLDDRTALITAMAILSIAMMRIKTDGKNGGDGFDV